MKSAFILYANSEDQDQLVHPQTVDLFYSIQWFYKKHWLDQIAHAQIDLDIWCSHMWQKPISTASH